MLVIPFHTSHCDDANRPGPQCGTSGSALLPQWQLPARGRGRGVRWRACCDPSSRPSLVCPCWRPGWSWARRRDLLPLRQGRTDEEGDRRRSPTWAEAAEVAEEEGEEQSGLLDERQKKRESEKTTDTSRDTQFVQELLPQRRVEPESQKWFSSNVFTCPLLLHRLIV